MGYQTAPHGSLGLPGGLYQFMGALPHLRLPTRPHRPPHPPPTRPPSIESIRDITGTEKNCLKNQQLLNS